MSIIKALSGSTTIKLIIPCAGKMFRSNITKTNKALCFCINKGYFQTYTLADMLRIKDEFSDKDFVFVGDIDKISISNGLKIVYRQRIFFRSFKKTVDKCKFAGVRIDIDPAFHITINNILNCIDDLKYIERYAKKHDETIEEYLTHTCLLQVNEYLTNYNMVTNLSSKIKRYGKMTKGYLDRAPYLAGSYNIELHTSSLIMLLPGGDFYSVEVDSEHFFDMVGYTTENIEKDIKNGVLY